MLINTADTTNFATSQVSETQPEISVSDENFISGYVRYSLHSRKEFFYHAVFKAYDLEYFKADIRNAQVLASVLEPLLRYFIPVPENTYIITTPKRAHADKLGYHFATEVLKFLSHSFPINFIPDVFIAKDKNKIDPVFFQVKSLPENAPIILFDDIFTTGKTIRACLNLLKENPANKLLTPNIPVLIGINNN